MTGLDRLGDRRLYLCTGDRPDLARFLDACLAGGVDLVQLRDKHLDARALLARARVAAAVCRDHGVPFILNDRPDLALECGADGVHVGQDDEEVAAVREQVGERLLIGLSTHSPEQFGAALESEADQLSVGPVWETPTKPGRPAAGLDYVRHAAAHGGDRPWFAIGGIHEGNVTEVVAAGARRIVVVRAIRDATDPEGAARRLREALPR